MAWRPRPSLVWLHRWVGLVMTVFLVIAGLTGSLLAWYEELEVALSPQLFRVQPSHPEARPIDPLVLRERLIERHPGVSVPYLPLHVAPDRALAFFVDPPPVPGGPDADEPASDDQYFVDPYTGEELGSRRWGAITQGLRNLMPFVYRLHYQLALGSIGTTLFGIVALAWTLDCFVGAYLTFPASIRRQGSAPTARGKSWWSRWRPAWQIRWLSGAYKLNVDLHRAGGLWTWAMLFVLAWSSVAFNLSEVYQPVMRAMFAHQPDEDTLPRLATPQPHPPLDWSQARDRGRLLMAEAARRDGFVVHREDSLVYLATHGIYRYDVLSSRDLRERNGQTAVFFSASTGELRSVWLPTGAASGDTIRTWLTSLHMAGLWGLPLKLLLCVLGLAVATLCITGVVVWLRKRDARRRPVRL